MIRVTVWNEHIHEDDENHRINEIYPNGLEGVLKEIVEDDETIVKTAILKDPEHGLSEEVLDNTDVLIWWAHVGHARVDDKIVERVCDRVLSGMGIIFLHSSHFSKPFKKLLGTTSSLKWRESKDWEKVWTIIPTHPIAKGIPEYFLLDEEEMYGEPFDIPTPDELIFLSAFEHGEVFRSGCFYRRGRGKIFYFQPGHETHKSFYNPHVKQIIRNAVRYVKPEFEIKKIECNFYPIDGK